MSSRRCPAATTFAFEVVLSSTNDYDQLLPLAQKLADDAMKTGKFAFTNLDVKIDQPQSEVEIDRNKVAALGLNLQQVGNDLAAAMGGNYVNFFDISGRSYKVIPQLKRIDRLNPDQLRNIYVTGPNGKLIPLSTVATIKDSTVARSLNRFQQLNAVLITGYTFAPLDQALKGIEEDAAKILPAGYTIDYMGESRQLRLYGRQLPILGNAGAGDCPDLPGPCGPVQQLPRSAGHHRWIMVPLAIFGSAVFMFLRMPNANMHFWTDGWTTTLNIYSKVGLVTLVGLISKNGILIVEFANKLQLAGKSKMEAAHEAAMTRLRPILMTSVATVAGHFPLTS